MGKIIQVNEFILFTRFEEELSTLFIKDAHTGHAQQTTFLQVLETPELHLTEHVWWRPPKHEPRQQMNSRNISEAAYR